MEKNIKNLTFFGFASTAVILVLEVILIGFMKIELDLNDTILKMLLNISLHTILFSLFANILFDEKIFKYIKVSLSILSVFFVASILSCVYDYFFSVTVLNIDTKLLLSGMLLSGTYLAFKESVAHNRLKNISNKMAILLCASLFMLIFSSAILTIITTIY